MCVLGRQGRQSTVEFSQKMLIWLIESKVCSEQMSDPFFTLSNAHHSPPKPGFPRVEEKESDYSPQVGVAACYSES